MYLSIDTAKDLITEADQNGVKLTLLDDGTLQVEAKQAPPPELFSRLKECKPFIVQVLGRRYITIEDLPHYGLELMADDYRFLSKAIPRGFDGHELLSKYIEYWLNGMANEPADHRKQNAGRAAANLVVVRHNKQAVGYSLKINPVGTGDISPPKKIASNNLPAASKGMIAMRLVIGDKATTCLDSVSESEEEAIKSQRERWGTKLADIKVCKADPDDSG